GRGQAVRDVSQICGDTIEGRLRRARRGREQRRVDSGQPIGYLRQWLTREFRFAVQSIDVVAAILVYGEREPVLRPGGRQCGADVDDAADSGEEIGHLVEFLSLQYDPVEVGNAVPVGDEEEALPIPRPRRVHVLGPVHSGNRPALLSVEIEKV